MKLCGEHENELKKEKEKMETGFPKANTSFLKASDFQDQEIPLTFKGWEKKANTDREVNGKVVATWKQNLKYMLKYTYPQFAIDEAGEQRIGKDGKPFQNSNYDPKFPQGYTIVYHFEEGQLESGSLPLWNAFCHVSPEPGDQLVIGKTGLEKETKWKVRRALNKSAVQGELPSIQLDEKTPF